MKKQEFYEQNDQDFLPLGFTKRNEEEDWVYAYQPDTTTKFKETSNEDFIPELLFNIHNKQFAVYIEPHTIWIDARNPRQALAFFEKIIDVTEAPVTIFE